MFRRCLIVLVFLTVLSPLAAAQQPAPSHQWRRIARLPPGSQLLVRLVDVRNPQPCTLAWIDNAALACDIFVPATGPRRVVFPIASVASIKQQSIDDGARSDSHVVALCVGMALGGVIGGVGASQGGARDAFAGGLLGSLAGGGIAFSAASSFNPRPQPAIAFQLPLRAPRLPIGRRHL